MTPDLSDAVAELAEIAVELVATDERQAGRVLDVATRLRATLPEVVNVGTDDEPTLFEVPREVPPGARFAVRRADGVDLFECDGADHATEFMFVDGPDDWSPANSDADTADTPVVYEMVMFAPTTISKRTFGRGSLRGEGAVA
jgi:hypothetical protein